MEVSLLCFEFIESIFQSAIVPSFNSVMTFWRHLLNSAHKNILPCGAASCLIF